MRGADREIQAIKWAKKQTKAKLKRAQRTLRAAVARRSAAKRNVRQTRSRLREARAALAATATEPPPPPDAATAILALLETAPVEPASEDVASSDDANMGFLTAERVPAVLAPAILEVTSRDVVKLQKQLKKRKHVSKKARKRARSVWRNVRLKRNSLASLKARQRGAVARREGAESALASRILSMSALARHRATNQTNARPGIDSGFAWPARGRLSQTYGCTGFHLNPPRGSCRHFHDGLDIASYLGSPIRAAAVGVVSYVGWNPWDQRGRAFIIVVSHPGGYETLYGHVLPTRRVRVGQFVRKGQLIGNMGNTGRSTGVHLHFELRRGRTTVNPLAFL